MNIRDKTKELIGILSTKYKMQIFEESEKICCNGGRLMNLPVQILILPKLGIACFIVCLKSEINNRFLNIDIKYIDDIPLEKILDNTIEKLIKAIHRNKE